MKESKKLTQEQVRQLFDYDPETGRLFWKVRRAARYGSGKLAGSIDCNGYRNVCIKRKRYYNHRIIWLFYYGYFPENDIDHINHDRDDNRICNLRELSRQCNLRNSINGKRNTSGIKGVSWEKRPKKWVASIFSKSRHRYLGGYDDINDAACARLAGEQCLGWEYCDNNSPAFKYVKENINKGAK